MPTSKPPLVLVKWNDANVDGDDIVTLENVDAFHKPTIVNTLGWLLKSDEVGVTLVNEYYDELFRGRTFIYRPMIISVIPYNLTPPRKPKRARKPAVSPDADRSQPESQP